MDDRASFNDGEKEDDPENGNLEHGNIVFLIWQKKYICVWKAIVVLMYIGT